MRRERVKQIAVAMLRVEQARARMAIDAAGVTSDELDAGRTHSSRIIGQLGIERRDLVALDSNQLDELVDTYMAHEESKR